MSCCKQGNKTGCCKSSNSTGCCKQKSKISEEEYDKLKASLKEEIKDYKVIDYMDENSEHKRLIEVEFENYVLELENVDTNDITMDIVINEIIKNNMV